MLLRVVGSCCAKFETLQTFIYVEMDATTPNNVGSCWPTMLRPFARGFNSQRLDSSGFMNEVRLECFPGINAFIFKCFNWDK